MQFIPNAAIGPSFNLLIVIALEVKPCQAGRTHGVKRKAAISVGIDQFVIGRRTLR